MKLMPPSAQRNGGFIPPPDYVDYYVLVGDTARTINIPSGTISAVFWCSGDVFYVDWSGAAAVIPTGDLTDGSAPDVSPVQRTVAGYSSFSVIAPDGCDLYISFWE